MKQENVVKYSETFIFVYQNVPKQNANQENNVSAIFPKHKKHRRLFLFTFDFSFLNEWLSLLMKRRFLIYVFPCSTREKNSQTAQQQQ